jgi:acyl dehydratase
MPAMSDDGVDLVGQRMIDSIPLGSVMTSQGRTLSHGECGVLISLTWLHSPMHADAPYAQGTLLGDLVLPGVLLVPIAMGLVLGQTTQHHRQGLGLLGIAELSVEASFAAPVYLNDTIRATTTFTDARLSKSRPGHVVATLVHELYKQNDELAMRMTKVTLYKSDGRHEGEL